MAQQTGSVSRLELRKARTRAALVQAAQAFIATGRTNVAILDITQAADVGMGSFYNHFRSREQLFQAAVEDALDVHGDLLDELTSELTDPAHMFAQNFRMTGRLHRHRPELSRVVLRSGLDMVGSGRGASARVRRDIDAAVRAGRFRARDTELALVVVVGAMLCLGQFLHDHPERDDTEATDQIIEELLRMFGLSDDEAREICGRPLPDLPAAPVGLRPTGPPQTSGTNPSLREDGAGS
ncbi:TetR/AcrR family transcriptional regulator [Streptomyces sp. S3(2020)]|uniref:TetR/AcrR family transcriptional regulator n=1 Tax=Streptomyces sp. S3(2020) TaxID=2732044 RepID=UPI00148937A5|nr:TetR/AcrR family transcriptional regulator [Streptomyces sp. S3(2020)]NNN29180.1 TetR/AcrR family transcriptional regulator [Streptomyces sp. S3(2020)]